MLLFSVDFFFVVVVVSDFISLCQIGKSVSAYGVFFFSLLISPHSGGKKNADSKVEVAASVPCKFSVCIMCALVEVDECCGLLKVMNIMADRLMK